jgi:methionine aminopeptidase
LGIAITVLGNAAWTAQKYCDMTPESRNSLLLRNGSLTHVSMEMRIRGDLLDTERAFHVNRTKKFFHGYAQATNIFHGYALDYIRSRRSAFSIRKTVVVQGSHAEEKTFVVQ